MGAFLIMVLEDGNPRGYLQRVSHSRNTFSLTDYNMSAKCYATRTAAEKDLERVQAIEKCRDFTFKII